MALSKLLLALLVALAPAGPIRAATDITAVPASQSGMILLVFETDDCSYCRLFRSEIRPAYEQGPRARSVPMHFVDALQVDAGKIGLAAPVTVVPTVVLMKDGEEVERLAGYTGPETFFQAVTVMLRRAE